METLCFSCQCRMTWLMAGVVCFTAIASVFGSHAPVRLVNGGDPYQGRLEVFYNNEWGTVCDDGWTDIQCQVVCRQLNLTGGETNKQASAIYGQGSGPILLDDVVCDGDETYLTECPSSHWGVHNCGHAEDVGCMCQSTVIGAGCNLSRHRISPFDPMYPGIGRVEVQDETGYWWTVCDDFWDDVDAAVFCDCLGYTQRNHFRAYWSRELINMGPALPIRYEAVHCGVEHLQSPHNIWDCPHNLNGGNDRCDSNRESAAVACQDIPRLPIPVAPTVNVSCEADSMQVCFDSTHYTLSSQHLSLLPGCGASSSINTTTGVCYNIPMDQCAPTTTTTDHSYKHYCYNVTYSEYTMDPSVLMQDTVWTRHACCSHHKNGSVDASFLPLTANAAPVYSVGPPVNFTLRCYNDSLFTEELVFPSHVVRGDTVYCRVTAHSWDEVLMLVAPKCRFMASTIQGSPEYTFHQNKCPATKELSLSYFNFDNHNWGFQFLVPKFQGYDDLYLTCDVYVCDLDLDSKPYCDRTCTDITRRKRRAAAFGKLEYVKEGPFVVEDRGFGPLVLGDGTIAYMPMPEVTVKLPPAAMTADSPSLGHMTWVRLAAILLMALIAA